MEISNKTFYCMPPLKSGRSSDFNIMGCYSCFTKCSIVKGKCFAEPELKNSCSIWKNRQTDPAFYYGAGWHGMHPLASAVRSSIIWIQNQKEAGAGKESIAEYIEKYIPRIASYLRYYRTELKQCPSPDFDIKRLSKITKYYTEKKLSGLFLPEYPIDYINKMMALYEKNIKEKPEHYIGKRYKTTRLPKKEAAPENNGIPKDIRKPKRKEERNG